MTAAALIPVPTESTLGPLLVRATDYIRASRAESTLRGYRTDFRDFSEFCKQHGFTALPAAPETVCSYVAQLADSGKLKTGSIQRRVSAIAAAHMAANFDSPTSSTAVRLCLAGIRRKLGTRQEGKAPTLTSDLAAMLAHLPAGLLGIRDRALLLVGFAGAFRRSELVALNVEDLTFGEDGVKVLIRRSKTDQEGAGQVVGIAKGTKLCPVEALQAWLLAASITSGPIFRPVNRHGHVQAARPHGPIRRPGGEALCRRCGSRSPEVCRAFPPGWPRDGRRHEWRCNPLDHEADPAQERGNGGAVHPGHQPVPRQCQRSGGSVPAPWPLCVKACYACAKLRVPR